jgi:hypothetical protein
MLHPRPERLELTFPWVANASVAGWWVLNIFFGLLFLPYAWASFWIVRSQFSQDGAGFFVAISVVFWGCLLNSHPLGRMMVQELVIDRSTGMIDARGLVHGRSVVVQVPIAALVKVKYAKGSRASWSPSAAEIDFYFVHPHRVMRFPRMSSDEASLCSWLCTMLGQPVPEH